MQHQIALCTKIFYALAETEKSKASMARHMVLESAMKSRGGTWEKLEVLNRVLSPEGVDTKLGRFTGCLVN